VAHKTYFNWSTGKNSSLALYHLLQDESYSIELLMTSVNSHHNRISMHGLRRSLAIGIPLTTIELPKEPTTEVYNVIMGAKIEKLVQQKFTHSAFGDIFLEDLRKYREEKLNQFNLQAVFPLWKKDTKELIFTFLEFIQSIFLIYLIHLVHQ
jgi:diphthamide synthase (EF-2-diphthine--ammonia ligase)